LLLPSLLKIYPLRESTDARDSVYSLLVLTQLRDTSKAIIPKYEVSITGLHKVVASESIAATNSLDILYHGASFGSPSSVRKNNLKAVKKADDQIKRYRFR
jgi:hypothetical protein